MTTHKALRLIAKKMSIAVSDIGYAGLKDKFAVTEQYVTIKNPGLRGLDLDALTLVEVGKTNKHISIGNLIGNDFTITLHGCKNIENIEKIGKELTKGVPNYFGLQRFGTKRNNHVIGKLLVQRRFDEALDKINASSHRNYSSLREVDKKMLKFFMHAYQSWIFNETLNGYMTKSKKPLFKAVPVVGFDTKIKDDKIGRLVKNILIREKIKPTDFRISELKIACRGSKRDAFIDVDLTADSDADKVVLRFVLPKGSYATNIIREISKNEKEKVVS
jgi:tRNA pseudouridine13 synthase